MSVTATTHLLWTVVCTFPLLFWLANAADIGYVVAIDAGSSSTKLKIYQHIDEVNSLVPRIQLNYSQKFLPALSSITDDFNVVQKYFDTITSVIKKKVPTSLYSDTSVYLWATAGMRLVCDGSNMMTTILNVLRDSSLKQFRFKYFDSEILSGEEEAVYSWVAVNYLLGCFNRLDRPLTDFHGVMEMGGKSTQIAFMPKGSILNDEFHVSINGRLFKLYAHSYLQYGIDGLPIRVAEILKKTQISNVVNNPCMVQGDTANVTLESNDIVIMTGQGKVPQCLEILHNLLDPSEGIHCEPKPCAVGPVYQASVGSIHFYATQVFTHVPESLKSLKNGTTLLNLKALKKEGDKFCNKRLSEHKKPKFASSDCLLALFMPILFETSYGFTSDTDQINVSSKINNQDIEWSLGAVLVHLLRERHNETSAFFVKRALI